MICHVIYGCRALSAFFGALREFKSNVEYLRVSMNLKKKSWNRPGIRGRFTVLREFLTIFGHFPIKFQFPNFFLRSQIFPIFIRDFRKFSSTLGYFRKDPNF